MVYMCHHTIGIYKFCTSTLINILLNMGKAILRGQSCPRCGAAPLTLLPAPHVHFGDCCFRKKFSWHENTTVSS